MSAPALFQPLDSAIWELGEAFEGLPDEDLWKRAHPRLLSIGELATHIAYAEAVYFIGVAFESPLNDARSQYYPFNVEAPFSLPMTAQEVYAEMKRVHEAGKVAFFSTPRDLESANPMRSDWTWAETLRYMAFHIAYHTGQIYSVRHLFGHETVDN